jgi:hypothetical protein
MKKIISIISQSCSRISWKLFPQFLSFVNSLISPAPGKRNCTLANERQSHDLMLEPYFVKFLNCQITCSKVKSNKENYDSLSLFMKANGYNHWYTHSVYHRFRKAKFANGSSILSLSQFLLLPLLPQKMKVVSKVVEFVSKSSARNQRSKFVKLAVIGIQEAKIGTTKSWKTKLLERSRIIQGLKVILVLYEKKYYNC